jgi:diguanylate cyclase (GGDEF)-like protein
MPKQKLPGLPIKSDPPRLRPVPAKRRIAPEREGSDQRTAPATPSAVNRLAAEVERLQVELASMRAKLAELEAKVDVDPLLDIFNRRGFERELKRALAYVTRYGTHAALVYLDLDGFKPVNDTYGHAAGDAVLKAVAAMLTRNVRASDTVARLGGDEFALILWNLSEADAVKKARALEKAISAISLDWKGGPLSVGASIGVAVLNPSDHLAKVMAAADQAMYARKAKRRGTILPSAADGLTQ